MHQAWLLHATWSRTRRVAQRECHVLSIWIISSVLMVPSIKTGIYGHARSCAAGHKHCGCRPGLIRASLRRWVTTDPPSLVAHGAERSTWRLWPCHLVRASIGSRMQDLATSQQWLANALQHPKQGRCRRTERRHSICCANRPSCRRAVGRCSGRSSRGPTCRRDRRNRDLLIAAGAVLGRQVMRQRLVSASPSSWEERRGLLPPGAESSPCSCNNSRSAASALL